MQLIDPKHSFYRPLPIRLGIVGVCLGWSILEATTGEPFWSILTGALGIYAAYVLLVNYTPEPDAPKVAAPADETDDAKD
jgi:hypothetical protein